MTALVPTTIDLKLEVSGPSTIQTFRDFQLTTKLTNVTGDPITLVSEPSGILSYVLPTEQYIVSASSGKRVKFKGAIVDFSLETAIEDDCVVTLARGESITVEHDLSDSYDFTTTGDGQYTFVPMTHFYVVNTTTKQYMLVEATPSLVHGHSVLITGIPVISHDHAGTKPEAGEPEAISDDDRFVGIDDPNRRNEVKDAMELADDYIDLSRDYLRKMSGTMDRYKTWFGIYDEERKKKVLSIFDKISGRIFKQTFNGIGRDCKCGCNHKISTCTHAKRSCPARIPCHCKSTIAYVFRTKPGTIYIMQGFWRLPMEGIKCKPGTLVHELTHFEIFGGTRDHKYGQAKCQKLAKRPDTAINNADSLRFFAENVPELK